MLHDIPFHLGCPAWSIASWKGNFLPSKARAADFLTLYSRVFNTVEGNTTFYALPRLETARKWADAVQPGFEFCFKVPRDISHGPSLLGATDIFSRLVEFLEIFHGNKTLGPTFLQLHHRFGPSRLMELRRFLSQWPREFPLAVEVRHSAFFSEKAEDGVAVEREHERERERSAEEAALNELLVEYDADRVIFDSRALYHAPPDDDFEAASQTRKPNLPVRWMRTGRRPFLRLVGRNQIELSDVWLKEAAAEAANWIREGTRPYLFMHAPDDTFAPMLCERFYGYVQSQLEGLPDLDMRAPHRGAQLELF